MKRNIDLTENMMFSRGNIPLTNVMRQLSKELDRHLRFRWNFGDQLSSRNESMIPFREQIIPLGNRERRIFIAECKEADSPYYCDCCGAYLLKKPWQIDGLNTLCTRCYNQIEKDIGEKFPWEMSPDQNNILWN